MTPAATLTMLIEGTPPSELPALAGELARALAVVVGRVATTPSASATTSPPTPGGADDLLTIDEAATRLRVRVSWLYRHARDLPFTRKLGHRTLRFDARGLDRWAASRPRA